MIAILLSSSPVAAQWDGDSSVLNNLVSATFNNTGITISDKYGGAIRCWEIDSSVYIQRKTVGGIVRWNDVSNPVVVFQGEATGGYAEIADMIPDGAGGAYISTMYHTASGGIDLYVQHIASNGERSWDGNGVKINPAAYPVCTEGKLCLMGNDLVIAWGTEEISAIMPSPDSSLLFIQKISSGGEMQWDPAGIAVSLAAGKKFWPVLAADSSNGVYISFTDTRNSARDNDGLYDNFDLFAQHFNADGQRLWSTADITISDQPFHQVSYNDYAPTSVGNRPSMLTDEQGNVIIAYENYVDDLFPDAEFLEVQKLNSAGSLMWSSSVKVDQQQGNKLYLQSAPDGNNGLVLCWKNVQGAGTVYAQRITSTGALPWGNNGIVVNNPSEMDFSLSDISMVNDEAGDFVVVWKMDTTDVNSDPTQYLKAQKFDSSGTLLWPYPGILVSTVDNDLPNVPQIVKSIDNATLFTWRCARGLNAALVKADGSLADQPVINFTAIASGNWDDPSIWAGGMVPVPGANITITQNITVNVNIIINSISVQSPAVVTINPGVNVTVFSN